MKTVGSVKGDREGGDNVRSGGKGGCVRDVADG